MSGLAPGLSNGFCQALDHALDVLNGGGQVLLNPDPPKPAPPRPFVSQGDCPGEGAFHKVLSRFQVLFALFRPCHRTHLFQIVLAKVPLNRASGCAPGALGLECAGVTVVRVGGVI